MKIVPVIVITLSASGLGACTSMDMPRPGSSADYLPTDPIAPRPAEFNNGAIYQAAQSQGLFEDYKARRVGDILTVVLNESTNAQKSATTSTSKDSDASLELGDITFNGTSLGSGSSLFSASNTGSRSFDGSGDAAQSNQIDGEIAVTVAEVLTNGNLIVQGEKWLQINQGKEFVRLRGIVRPVDISAENTVDSTRIANAQVYYGGIGALADSNAQGWLSRFFNSPIFPF